MKFIQAVLLCVSVINSCNDIITVTCLGVCPCSHGELFSVIEIVKVSDNSCGPYIKRDTVVFIGFISGFYADYLIRIKNNSSTEISLSEFVRQPSQNIYGNLRIA